MDPALSYLRQLANLEAAEAERLVRRNLRRSSSDHLRDRLEFNRRAGRLEAFNEVIAYLDGGRGLGPESTDGA